MRALSATQAFTPALHRATAILFRPFHKGRSWKLAATAYLSTMGLAFIPTPLIFLASPGSPGQQEVYFHVATATVSLLFCALLLVFFYLGSRLQFVIFAITTERNEMVAPLWRRYGARTWPWLGLKLVLSLAVVAISAVPVFYAFRSFAAQMATLPAIQPGQLPPPQMFSSFALFYIVLLAPIAILMLISSLLSDFVLPPIALEDASLSDVLSRFFRLIQAEPGQLLLYTFFKVLFAIAGLIAMEIAVLLAEFIALIPLGLLALLGWFLFRSLGTAGHLLLVAGGIVLMLGLVVFLFYVITMVLGWFVLFLQAYALYFLGGRYPLLGSMLEPPPPPMPPSLLEPAL